jgi:hypothetical protein
VLNAMTLRTAYRHSVEVLPATTVPHADPAGATAFLVVVLSGAVTAGNLSAGPLDALHIREPVAITAEPGSTLALIRIMPA